MPWLRVYRCSYSETESEEWVRLTLELGMRGIPASVIEQPTEPPGESILSATLTVGSAVYLGLGADRNHHWASQVGESLATLQVGKQYRLKATVIDCLNIDSCLGSGGFNSMQSAGCAVDIGAASGSEAVQPAVDWDPDSDDDPPLQFPDGGINFTFDQTPNGYAPGAVVASDWCTFEGPQVDVDIRISGQPLSGFCGFKWVVLLELQERDA